MPLCRMAQSAPEHCAGPRFRKDFRSFERDFFSFNASAQVVGDGRLSLDCRLLEPHYAIVLAALSLIVLVSLLQITRTAFRSCRSRNSRDLRGLEHSHSTMSVGEVAAPGHVPIMPKEAKLRGGHRFELHSSRIRTEEEVGWWLWCHLSAQLSILERQIQAEAAALRALKNRAKYVPRPHLDEETQEEGDSGHLGSKGDFVADAMVIARGPRERRRAMDGTKPNQCLAAKGGQAEDVVLVVLRRHAYEWQAEGILCDPGRIAIGLSRASHTMVMDYWARDCFGAWLRTGSGWQNPDTEHENAEASLGKVQFWKNCLQVSRDQAGEGGQQRQRYPAPNPLQVHSCLGLFAGWRQFLVKATTVVNHGGSWTVGVPLAMAEGHLQADWEEIPTSFAQHIAQMVPEECPTVRLTRHKADEFHLGATVFYSQTCRSWRSEVQILDPGGNILLTSYWGMGLHRQSKYIYGLVLRISSRTVLESSNSWTMESHCKAE
ncbi:Hypothetical protein (Fragment) [Durusdinium trenchii]|uniref:Uncharacterized protein n=1 Tax=Durusdinium trenchii TaxID=1381693 RepID=A0ABP0RFP8_9DINO